MSSLIDRFPAMDNTVTVRVRDGKALRQLGFYDALGRLGFRDGIDDISDPRFSKVLADPKWDAATRSHSVSKNQRTYMGRDNWQRFLMFGDIAANSTFAASYGTASTTTIPTSTQFTISTGSLPTSGGVNGGLQGHVMYCPSTGVYGVILSNTSTAVTVDQWTSMSTAGTVGTMPGSGAAYVITPGGGPGCWIGLSSWNGSGGPVGGLEACVPRGLSPFVNPPAIVGRVVFGPRRTLSA